MSISQTRRVSAAALALLAVASVAAPASAAIPLFGTLVQDARASQSGQADVTDLQSAGLPPQPIDLTRGASLNRTSRATQTFADPTLGLVTVSDMVTSAGAVWNSATLGSMLFADSWSINETDPLVTSRGASTQIGNGVADWIYSFQATADGAFKMDAKMDASGSLFSSTGRWDVDLFDETLGVDLSKVLGAGFTGARGGNINPEAGSFTGALTADHVYIVSLINHNIVGSSGAGNPAAGDRSGLELDSFNWSISEAEPPPPITPGGVPEPASWALMIGGFFGMGAVLRRSRNRGLAQTA
jgi:hypothetical protein